MMDTPLPAPAAEAANSRPTTDGPMGLAAVTGSVTRVRYMVDVQSLSGIWQNVEIIATEEAAREKEAEWKEWLTENRKTWKDIRIVKESTVQEVLQNNAISQPHEN